MVLWLQTWSRPSLVLAEHTVSFIKERLFLFHMVLPPTAKRVFKGVLFDVYHWPQEMFDGSTETWEHIVRHPVVGVLATMDGKMLVIDQEQPARPLYPSIPAGEIEQGETPLEAAKRELLEETGCESDDWELYSEYPGRGKVLFHEHLFIARGLKKTAEQRLDAGERISVRSVSFDDFLSLCRIPTFAVPLDLKFEMYEALLEEKKKEGLRKKIFG